MKSSEYAMIILIAGLSVLGAYLVVTSMVSGLKTTAVDVPTSQPISSTLTQPDPTIFNSGAINPTVQVNIGTNNSGQ